MKTKYIRIDDGNSINETIEDHDTPKIGELFEEQGIKYIVVSTHIDKEKQVALCCPCN